MGLGGLKDLLKIQQLIFATSHSRTVSAYCWVLTEWVLAGWVSACNSMSAGLQGGHVLRNFRNSRLCRTVNAILTES